MKTPLHTSSGFFTLAFAMLALAPAISLLAQADFPYVAKSVVRTNHPLTSMGTGSFLTVSAPEASTTAGGDVYRVFATAPSYAQARLYDSRAMTVIQSSIRNFPGVNGQSGDLAWVYDADANNTYFTALQARVPKGASFRATMMNGSSRASQLVQFMFSKNQPLVQLKSGSTVQKSWSLLPNGMSERFSLRSSDRFVQPFTITAANRYVLRYLSNTSTAYPQKLEIISLSDLPKWQAGLAVTAKVSFTSNAWEKPLVLPAGNYAFVAKYARGLFHGAFDLLEYRPSPTSTWAAQKGDFPIVPANKHLSTTLLSGSGTSGALLSKAPVPVVSGKGNSFSVLAASTSASILPAAMASSQASSFAGFKALPTDSTLLFGRGNPGLYLKSHLLKAFIPNNTYTLGARNDSVVSAYHGNPFNMLISRDIDTVTYSSAGKTKVWARQMNSTQSDFSLGLMDQHLRSFTVTADARYVLRYVSDEKTGTAQETLYVFAKSKVMRLMMDGQVTPDLVISGKSSEQVLTLPAGDYVFFAVANGYGLNSAAYELIEYR